MPFGPVVTSPHPSVRQLIASVLRRAAAVAITLAIVLGRGPHLRAADWQTGNWQVVKSTSGATKRSAPIRTVVSTAGGRLLGTRSAGAWIELWASDNNGIDWVSLPRIAQSSATQFGDPTLTVLPSGEILAGYRENDPTLGWRVQTSRSLDGGQTWTAAGTIHDWTNTQGEFVGAPFFNRLSDGTLQAYYDSEPAAPGSSQYIAVKTGAFNAGTNQWNWTNPRVVNSAPANATFVRDGLASVVNLGPDLDGVGDRLMVVTEAISVTGGVAHNVIRAFEVQNGGAAQADWNSLLDSRVIYESPALDPAGHKYNAYAPFALRVGGGPVVVGFSTDEGLDPLNIAADNSSAPPDQRHSEIKLIQTTGNFETWSAPITVFGVNHPSFTGSYSSGDIFNYLFGMYELSPNDVVATLDMFGGKQLVFRPTLGGLSADFNDDGAADGADFLRWQRGNGLTGQKSTTLGDATGNGIIDGADLAKWRAQFGPLPASVAATGSVPEPATAALIAAGALTAGAIRSIRSRLRQ